MVAEWFTDSIRAGKFVNYRAEAATSNLARIPARTAACPGGSVTGDEMTDLNIKPRADLTI
jgi:hypothetical protein